MSFFFGRETPLPYKQWKVKGRGWTSKANAEVRIFFDNFWSGELRLLLVECNQHHVLDIAMLVL